MYYLIDAHLSTILLMEPLHNGVLWRRNGLSPKRPFFLSTATFPNSVIKFLCCDAISCPFLYFNLIFAKRSCRNYYIHLRIGFEIQI